ncbi:MAG: hypothetical protein ABS61_14600 [Microbacterium sp. SCN 70-18]|nr:MAG: hypothetical protein ABS61_14600 [Microbacterium sp. SCN 70-18]
MVMMLLPWGTALSLWRFYMDALLSGRGSMQMERLGPLTAMGEGAEACPEPCASSCTDLDRW